jgi:DNA polymerase III subunit chi
MTRVDFYTEAGDKLEVASRLATKAMRQGLRVLVYSRDEQTLARLSHRLWSSPPTGFVPHCRAHESIAAETPIVLARDDARPPHHQVLINLDDEWPPAFASFERLLEIVSGADDDDRTRARTRFKFYRDRGYEIHTHRLGASEVAEG